MFGNCSTPQSLISLRQQPCSRAFLATRSASVTTTQAPSSKFVRACSSPGCSIVVSAVHATGLRVLDLEVDTRRTTATEFAALGAHLIADGAEVIVLGCAGMAELQSEVGERLGAPVIDGVTAGVSLCEDLVHHGFKTSKVRTFAHIRDGKVRTARPPAFSGHALNLGSRPRNLADG